MKGKRGKKGKKAQVTLFVIIAIVIVAALATFFLLRPTRHARLPEDVQAIKDYARSCAESAFEDSLMLIGAGGGYIVPEEIFENEIIAAYWYKDRNTKIPSKEGIEEEISRYVETEMKECEFEKFAYKIEKGKASAKTKIKEDGVEIVLEFPIVARKGEGKEERAYRIEEPYKIRKNIRLGLMHSFSSGLVERIAAEPEYRPVSYLVDTFNIEGMNVTIIPYGDNDIYVIDELLEEYYLNGKPYTFMFAVGFE